MTVGLTVGSGPVCTTVSVPPARFASGPDRGLDNTEGWFSDLSTRPVYPSLQAISSWARIKPDTDAETNRGSMFTRPFLQGREQGSQAPK